MASRPSTSLTITQAQQDVRDVYASGWVGQLVAAGVWAVAGVATVIASTGAGMATLLVGGVFILPLTSLLLRLRGGPASLPSGHPMAALATQLAFTVPLGLLVALAAAGNREAWFFPAAMIIVGAHYLPFVFLYGMRLFAVLGGALVLGGLGLALWLPASASAGAWVGAGLLAVAALLLRRADGARHPRPGRPDHGPTARDVEALRPSRHDVRAETL